MYAMTSARRGLLTPTLKESTDRAGASSGGAGGAPIRYGPTTAAFSTAAATAIAPGAGRRTPKAAAATTTAGTINWGRKFATRSNGHQSRPANPAMVAASTIPAPPATAACTARRAGESAVGPSDEVIVLRRWTGGP